jgi:hypothetical protein
VSPEVQAAAEALAADLAATMPTSFEGDDGWYAVAERALEAAEQAGDGTP